ncbi:hypothetical protein FACS1894200_07350 [Spirochaetia bacterium]|nr:hypothetical protein FACS1894200_07350 [Spirochaetia bacterium]
MLTAAPLEVEIESKNPPYRMKGETETEFLERDPVFMETMCKDKEGTLKWYTITEEDRNRLQEAVDRNDRAVLEALCKEMLSREY